MKIVGKFIKHYNGKSKGIANPSRVMDNKPSSGFQIVPNILILTNNDELYMTLAATLKNVLDASKVYKNDHNYS